MTERVLTVQACVIYSVINIMASA